MPKRNPRKPTKPQQPQRKQPNAGKGNKRKNVDGTDFRPAIQPGYPDALDLDEGRR